MPDEATGPTGSSAGASFGAKSDRAFRRSELPRWSFHPLEFIGFSCRTQILSSSREASHELTSSLNRPVGTIATRTPLDVVSAVSTFGAAGASWGSMGVSGDARIEFTALSTI